MEKHEHFYSLISELKNNGPKDTDLLEKIALWKYENPSFFSEHEETIIKYMGLFYKKNIHYNKKDDIIFYLFDQGILDTFGDHFTPIQAEIKSSLINKKYFFFSAPTSSGKSYLLKDLIMKAKNDIAIIVPSRALLNEYVRDLKADLYDKSIRDFNVLPFVDQINKNHTKHNIFVLTPERAFNLFKFPNLNFDLFIFDEAQIIDSSDEIRSLKYRTLLRKINSHFKESKKLFAYPFVENLEEIQNYIFPDNTENHTKHFSFHTMGQIFVHKKNDKYKVFNKQGENIGSFENDPIKEILKREKSTVLIYCSKAKIFRGEIYDLIAEYTDYCEKITNPEALEIISKIKERIGANDKMVSKLVEHLENGIAIHHGGLPHTIRCLIESFINKNFSKICVCTTTLEQGVNMPFDAVFLYELTNLSQGMRLKNIIGRAGRTSTKPCFDYGIVVVRNKKTFIKNLNKQINVDVKSNIKVGDDFTELKESIENDTFNSDFNMPEKAVERLSNVDVFNSMKQVFELLKQNSNENFKSIRNELEKVYRVQLKDNRELTEHEKSIFTTAILILLWEHKRQKFSQIVVNRYNHLVKEKSKLWSTKFFMIPNPNQKAENLFKDNSKDYYFDLIVYDTYEFVDKCLNLYLKDIFAAATQKYLDRVPDDEYAKKFLQFLKYGSDVDEEAMLFRYGFVEDEIDKVLPCIESIDENEIVFNDEIYSLDEALLKKCLFYKYN